MSRLFRSVSRSKHYVQVISWLLLVYLFYSCASPKTITYFQGPEAVDTARYVPLASINPPVARIQTDDVLAIIVTSLSEETNAIFNILNSTSIPLAGYGAGGGNLPLGYLVDPTGSVEMPLLGKVKLAGLTLEEAADDIRTKLAKYLKEPTVNVRYVNRKFTVIGEVGRPGVYNLLDNQRTLPEVIGIAGELTVYGRRDNVMIMRTENNKREIVRVDLRSRKVLESPYYYIQHNDVIYVEPRPGRITSTERGLQLTPIILGFATTIVALLSFFRR
ncbi:polysaccharide biosynthesis/export family protein [Spirosoma validum]|uniref:Polysaccharide biosynthesis/export family protein n=1 Tax=Spirosoma validum TaxID=2771355 RepID=A0A927GD43_9BACT|nr:polysaccharide biosynthesis/export family protein [Spirosoma validum]MBD2753324.1 polysaccharide biosynthesis/export family protein [Spirosoma validum]